MKSKRIIQILLLILMTIVSVPNVKAVGTGVDASTGHNIPLVVESGHYSWWPSSGPQGIRITIAYANGTNAGNRVAGSVSVDYSSYTNLSSYYHFGTKKSKIEYIGKTNFSGCPSSNAAINGGCNLGNFMTRSGYIYKKPLVALENIIMSKNLPSTYMATYLQNYINVSKPSSRETLKLLINDLSGATTSPEMQTIKNEIAALDNCELRGTCNSDVDGIMTDQKYVFIVEPVSYIYVQSGKYKIAVTATEAALLMTVPGWVGGVTHNNQPKAIYVKEDWFSSNPSNIIYKVAGTLESKVTSTAYLKSSEIYGHSGVGVGVFYIYGASKPAPVVTTCTDTVCGKSTTCNDIEDWTKIKSIPASYVDSSLGDPTYCPVLCRQEVVTNFPSKTSEIIAGSHFVFEPIEITTTKECRSDVKLSAFKTKYADLNAKKATAYLAMKEAEAKKNAWAAIYKAKTVDLIEKPTGVDDIGACEYQSSGIPKDTWPYNSIFCPNATGSSSVLEGVSADYSYDLIDYISGPSGLTVINANVNKKKICRLREFVSPSDINTGIKTYPSGPIADGSNNIHKATSVIAVVGGNYNVTYTDNYAATNTLKYYVEPIYLCKFNQNQTISNYPSYTSSGGGTACDGDGCPGVDETTGRCILMDGEGISFKWRYTSPVTGNPVIVGGATDDTYTCVTAESVTALNDAYNSAKTTYDSYVSQINTLTSNFSKCDDWATKLDLNVKPSVRAVVTQKTDTGNVSDTYTLVNTAGTISAPSLKTVCPAGNAECSRKIYPKNCSYNSTTKRASCSTGSEYTSYPNITAASDTSVETLTYNLAAGVNQYVAVPSGKVYSNKTSFDANQKFIDIGYPNYTFAFKADLKVAGTISIQFKNIGENSHFDLSLKNKIAGGYSNYVCDYEFSRDRFDFVYRQVDLSNPFPYGDGTGREAGLNWSFDKERDLIDIYIIKNRDVVGDKIYSLEPMYVIDFTKNSSVIKDIKDYNYKNAYTNFDMKCTEGLYCRSNFLRSDLMKTVVESTCGMNDDWLKCSGVKK